MYILCQYDQPENVVVTQMTFIFFGNLFFFLSYLNSDLEHAHRPSKTYSLRPLKES